MPTLLRIPQRVAEDDERFFGKVVGGHHEIGLVEIHRVDVAKVDELDEVERLAAFQFDAFDLFRIEQDIMALGHLIALDDLVAVDGADPGHDLFIFDALARRLMDLVELDRRAALGRGIQLDRDRDEREPHLPAPHWSCRHRPLRCSGQFNQCAAESFPLKPLSAHERCDIAAAGRADRRSPSRR